MSAAYPQHDKYSRVACILQCLLLLDFIGKKKTTTKNHIYNSERENQQLS